MPGYVKQTWVDLDPTRPLSAARMEHLEDGIETADLDVQAETAARIAAISTEVTDRNNAISAAIATEVTNRNAAVSGEASTRSSADSALDSRVTALEGGGGGGDGWKAYRLETQHTDSTNTYDTLNFGTAPVLDASSTYRYRLELYVSFSISACSINARLTDGATTVSNAQGHHIIPAGGNPGVDAFYQDAASPFVTWGPVPGTNPGAGESHLIVSEGRFDTSATPGTLGVEVRISTTTGGGVMTITTASRLYLQKVVTEN